ncbi:MAG: TRAP transporter substrate-binding protein [Deltaproteobacteria bacterium]|nr:TRAP transporter substrate-binding protein [Deltaproteobacteria bacterium]MBW1979320.1 TRAP transporter substrate-binding protein [Deltaproteobacteria bacterium]MBW2045970.1 TRAP transporter substrate-binding protein [Deltaproteobacteria bacterium]MBW2301968.1 TRAP transporter substrate-binding protein [Deltaproteobacteria bacterium]
MKRIFGIVMLAVCIGLIGNFQGVKGAQAKPIELSFMHYFPPVHFVNTEIVQPWVKMIEEKSGGKLKFHVYPSAALAKPKDFLEAVVSGAVDIVMGYSGFHPGRFPVSEVTGLPFLNYTSTLCASKTYMQLFKTVPEFAKDWQGVKVLWFQTEPPMQLHTSKKPIRRLGDLKGVKIKISGQPAPFLHSLGAAPVVMASPEVYDALSKGVIEGVIYPWEAIKGWKLDERVLYHTWLNFYANPFYVVMNLDKWKSLPPDMKMLIDKYSGHYGTELAAKVWDKRNNEAYEILKKNPKHEIFTLPKSDMEKARALTKRYYDKWIAKMNKKGIDGKAILEKVRQYVERFSD